jgi:hypothetical protein
MDTVIRALLSNGDIQAILAMLGTDRREDFQVADLMGGTAGTITIAQVGRTLITVMPDGVAQVKVHTHDALRDAECWDRLVAELAALVEQHNATAQAVASNPMAQMLLAMGAPREVIEGALNGADTDPDATQPIPPVSLPVMDRGEPGFYL